MAERTIYWLVPIAGPELEALALEVRARPWVIGRHEGCDLRVPATAEKVSRFHVQLTYREGRWFVADLKSRWGSFLNGRRLVPHEAAAMRTGDLLHVSPWTFSLSATAAGRGLKLAAEDQQMLTMVRTHRTGSAAGTGQEALGEELLALLLESAAGIHHAADEQELADVVLETAARGTGLANGAVLRPLDGRGTFEIVASRGVDVPAAGAAASYSRTLIQAAAGGDVAEFSGAGAGDAAQSVLRMNVSAALCVPLMLGDTAAAYVYLDSRGGGRTGAGLAPHATVFCAALGRIASLAWAGLKRVEMERRAALVEAEFLAAAEAQRLILPGHAATLGRVSYIGESRPGQYVGGDLFNVLALENGRVAAALADVAGKGIPASVLMAAAQGYLHAALLGRGDLSMAIAALNAFVCPRCPPNKFMTLFAAVIDTQRGTLSYVDAGHGYGLVRRAGGEFAALEPSDCVPIGVAGESEFPAIEIPFDAGSELLIVSDGIIEQCAGDGLAQERRQFELSGVQKSMASLGLDQDPIGALFEAVVAFAGTSHLADDATAVLVRRVS